MKKSLFYIIFISGFSFITTLAMAACNDVNRANLLAAADAITNGGDYGVETYVAGENGGFPPLQMWVTVVDETGKVCHVVNTGGSGNLIGNVSWLGSRVISAQKANTANAFSIDNGGGGLKYTISTAILFGTVQGQNSLFGLQHSNPVNPTLAYAGNPKFYGAHNDPMVGKKIGGVNVFGGGLALYDADGNKIGALGVSGNTSCTDHVIAWKLRKALELDNIATGFTNFNLTNNGTIVDFGGIQGDEMIIDTDGTHNFTNGWEHAACPNTPGFPGSTGTLGVTDADGAILFDVDAPPP